MLRTIKCSAQIAQASELAIRNISTCTARLIDQKWREEKGLPENPNTYGPLTNLPDFTYLDGRPTPLGSNQRRRLIKQREIASKIVTFSGELDFAKKRYASKMDEKQKIVPNPFKAKGPLLLKKNDDK